MNAGNHTDTIGQDQDEDEADNQAGPDPDTEESSTVIRCAKLGDRTFTDKLHLK